MTTIHMEPEQVRAVIRIINRFGDELISKESTLRSNSGRLSVDWQGGGADTFQREMSTLLRNLARQIDEIQHIALRVSREVDEWESVASQFGPVLSSTGASREQSEISTITSIPEYDWKSWWISAVGVGISGIDELGKITYTSYRSIGRFLNRVAGSSRAGWVGRMDKLGHIIRNPTVQKMLPVIGYGFGVWDDLQRGDDWGRALGSELVDAGLNFIPIVAGYNLLLGVSNLAVGGADLLGYHEQAANAQEFLDKLDFSEKLGDAIYDYFTEKPVSAAISFGNPLGMTLNPDYQRFSGKFVADNLRDFGFDKAAEQVQNNTEVLATTMENIYSNVYDFTTSFFD